MENQTSSGCGGECLDGDGLRIFDAFSGIGAMRMGFEQACRDLGKAPRCVGFSEIDGKATETYLRHFPGTPPLGDIRSLAGSATIPDFDVILAGFCCQAFSKAGHRMGFEDARGTLFFSLAAILEAKRPKAFLFENVEHLVHHNKGRTLQRILEILEQLGYRTTWKVLNSQDFGVPQNRARIFLVGFREGGESFKFPEPIDSSKRLKDILETNPVDPRYYFSEQALAGARQRKSDNEAQGKGFGYRILNPDGVSNTLVCGGSGREGNLVIDRRISGFPVLPHRKSPLSAECIRTLTPLEWERLQGLPPNWTAGQADCHRYTQLGNAVTSPVIRCISCNILEVLKAEVPTVHEQLSASSVNGAVATQVVPMVYASGARHGVPGSFKYIDLCCGIGGFRQAMEEAGGKCVFSSEIDEKASLTYHTNFGEWPSGDICQIQGEDVPDHDILCAGFPCQPFSICGKQKGFADKTRGIIFFEIARIVKAKQPAVVFLENVPRLVTHDDGRTFRVIQGMLEELGYVVSHAILNSSLYGSPTARKRIYIVAFKADLGIKHFAFPKPTMESVKLADVLLPDSATDRWVCQHPNTIDEDLVARNSGTATLKLVRVGYVGASSKAKQGYRVYGTFGHAVTLCAHGGGMGAKCGLYYVNGRVRRLDPRECLRVMGYSDSFVIPPSIRPDQVRTLTGNTVVVPVVRRVCESIIASLSKANWKPTGTMPLAIQSAPTTKIDGSIQPQPAVASPRPVAPEYREDKAHKLLSDGISKKGKRVFAWAIGMPGDKCPFASELCAKYCYAQSGRFRWNTKCYEQHFNATKRDDFVESICSELSAAAWRNSGDRIACAVHEKGDFYSVDYLRKWGEVINRMKPYPNISFFVYTRAWISDPFRLELEKIGAGRNIQINLSTDREMLAKYGMPQRIGTGLVTFLAETDEDIPAYPVDLVFRNLRNRPESQLERIGGCLVCPHESNLFVAMKDGVPLVNNGQTQPIQCQNCRLCIDCSLKDWEKAKGRYAGTPRSNIGAVAA